MHSNPLWIGVEIVRETNTTSNLTLNVLESQICNLTQLVGMDDGCQPTKVSVCLEPDNLVLNMVVFPFATMLSSLLNCSILNKLEVLLLTLMIGLVDLNHVRVAQGPSTPTQKHCLFPKTLLGISLHL